MNTKEEADKLRQESKQILLWLFKVPDDFSSGLIERLVDCVIGASILEVANLQQSAQQSAEADLPKRDSCPECFGYRGFHTDYCSHNPASH